MRTYKKLAPFLPSLFLFGLGCNGCLGLESSPEKGGSRIPTSCFYEFPQPEIQKLDILFVIDDSDSMNEEQLKVRDGLTTFMDELRKSGGIDQSMHVAVITTSVYVFPENLSMSGRYCGIEPAKENDCPEGGLFLPVVANVDEQSSRVLKSDQPGFMRAFENRVHRGVAGSPQETSFEAVRLALLSELGDIPLAQGGNKGFLREGARLLIVVLTDEDDCSEMQRPPKIRVSKGLGDECRTRRAHLSSVEEYYDLFKNELGKNREVIWAAIAPVAIGTKEAAEVEEMENGDWVARNVDCPTSWSAGFRHREMAQKFDPTLQNLHSICLDSYHEPLLNIARMANVPQYIDLKNIPDKNLARVKLTREDGSQDICTLQNKGIAEWKEGTGEQPDRVYLSGENHCHRLPSDKKVEVDLFCVS